MTSKPHAFIARIGATALLCASSVALAAVIDFDAEPPPQIIPGDLPAGLGGSPMPGVPGVPPVLMSFQGISQYDTAGLSRNFIPPDTMGAVGRTQYMETTNGAYAVFDKATGNRLSLVSDTTFWNNAGQPGTPNGDTRIMYNAASQRWVTVSFGSSVSDLQIAVSSTDDALGQWQSVRFTGFAGGTADYPTLALDKNAVYIGTNNFKVGCDPSNPTKNRICGTTLNVIPIDSLFNAGAPTLTGMMSFTTPYTYKGPPVDSDRGFAIQGVNSSTPGSVGTIIASSFFFNDNLAYNINGLTTGSALGSTLGSASYLGMAPLQDAGPARQPATSIPANQRVIDALDQRISSSVYESNGRIYMVQTVNSGLDPLDEARIRYTVIDANTFAILDEGDIGSAGYDYYQGSIAVNALGQVVIGYDRSGLDPVTGKITFMARTYTTDPGGHLVQTGSELLLKESLTDDYHNGSRYDQPAADRQRWGDYSQVSIDPLDDELFWLVGEFALEPNAPEFGHPGGTGGTRWGTWITSLDVTDLQPTVPEPATWLLMLLAAGMSLVGMRQRRVPVRRMAA